jgi:hypothetical protein
MASRLFRSIVVFGSAMGASAGVVAGSAGCDLYFATPRPDPGPHGIIDASNWGTIADGPWPMIDASAPHDAGVCRDAADAADAQLHDASAAGSGSDS